MGVKFFGLGGDQEPTLAEVHEQQSRRPSATEAIAEDRRRKSIDNRAVTGASQITTRQSIIPVALVTTLFFLWGFAYGLLDVLNSRFQVALHITQGQSSGLQGAYFGYVIRRTYRRRANSNQCLLHRAPYVLGLVPSTLRIPLHVHARAWYLLRRRPHVLAVCC